MSGETEKQVSGWTVDTHKEHVDQRFAALTDLFNEKIARAEEKVLHVEELLSLTQKAAKDAVTKSEEATRIHFASVNEFNTRMKEVVTAQASKEWAEGFEKSVDSRFKMLEARDLQQQGQKEGVKLTTGFIVGILGAVATLITILIFTIRLIS